MQAMLLGLIAPLGKIGVSMLASLLTEGFLKKAIVIGLEKHAKKTESPSDDELVQSIKEAWKID